MTFLRNEDGQGMLEYVLIVGLIALIAVVAVAFLGPKIKNKFSEANDKLK